MRLELKLIAILLIKLYIYIIDKNIYIYVYVCVYNLLFYMLHISRLAVRVMRGSGSEREVSVAIKAQHEGSLWGWKCSVS